MDVQRTLESNVEKRTKDSFGPPPGKKLVVFIDDMNMPKVSGYADLLIVCVCMRVCVHLCVFTHTYVHTYVCVL